MLLTLDCSVRTGTWAGDCFIYTNNANRLNYLVGNETYTISHFDRYALQESGENVYILIRHFFIRPMYLLGYLPRDNRVYLADRVNIIRGHQTELHC